MTSENKRLNVASAWVKVKDSLAAGDLLLENGLFRDAVNRFYYACFHAVVAALLSRDSEPKTHSGARSELHRLIVEPGHLDRSYLKTLANLQKDREDCDYDRDYIVTEAAARADAADAHAFCLAVSELLQREGWLT